MDVHAFEQYVKRFVSGDHYNEFEYLLPDVRHIERFIDCLKAGYGMDISYAISNETLKWADQAFYSFFRMARALDSDSLLEAVRFQNFHAAELFPCPN